MTPETKTSRRRQRSRAQRDGVGVLLGAFVILIFAIVDRQDAADGGLIQLTATRAPASSARARRLLHGRLGLASVPLYRMFCQVTGLNGTTRRRGLNGRRARSGRKITVRFDANVAPSLPWTFKPEQTT